MTKPLDPKTFPIDTSRAFNPTKTYWLKSTSRFSTDGYAIFDLPTDDNHDTLEVTPKTNSLSDASWKAIEHLVHACLPSLPILSASKKGMLSSTWTLSMPNTPDPLVTFTATASGMGRWDFTFPPSSPHSSHPLELVPVGVHRAEKMFVRESVPYFWEMHDSDRRGVLYKVVNDKRVVVAELRTVESGFKKDVGVVIDEEEAYWVVVLATAIAMSNKFYSFDKSK